MKRYRRIILVFISLFVLLPGAGAIAAPAPMSPQARVRFERGLKLFNEKKYDDAIRALREGYALSAAPDFLYALGQVERVRGNCATAIIHYQAFIDTAPRPDQLKAAQFQLDRCKATLAPAPAKAPEPAEATPATTPPPTVSTPAAAAGAPAAHPAPAAPAASDKTAPAASSDKTTIPGGANLDKSPPAQRAETKSWYRDPLGGALLGGGVALLGGGLALYLVGRGAAADAGLDYDRYLRASDLAWAQPAGVAVLAGGGALIAGAVVRYLLVSRTRGGVTAFAAPQPGGGLLVVVGRFW